MSRDPFDAVAYWRRRYEKGGDSGSGSYGRLAQYKAAFLNEFVRKELIATIIELGCGDGAQLDLAEYPQYIGVDISPVALETCRQSFWEDFTKSFMPYTMLPELPEQDLALSLDVIFHLVEDPVYERYMQDLFASASRFVVIYSSNREAEAEAPHVRHRCFTRWVAENQPDWRLIANEPNPHPEDPGDPDETSFAEFFVYRKG